MVQIQIHVANLCRIGLAMAMFAPNVSSQILSNELQLSRKDFAGILFGALCNQVMKTSNGT